MDKTCFLISPIGKPGTAHHGEFREIFEHVIKPAVEESDLNLKVVRADDITRSGSIIRDILEHVAGAYLVIADLTGQNPNVFYELGVRHSLSPRTILISQEISDIPFDLGEYRTITYDPKTPAGIAAFRKNLTAFLQELRLDPQRPDSPVLEKLGTSKIVRLPSATLATELRVPLNIRHAGLRSVYKKFPVEDMHNTIEEAKHSVSILTTWLHQAVHFGPALCERAQAGVSVTVLMLDPESDAARQRAVDLGYSDPSHVGNSVRGAIDELRRCTQSECHGSGKPQIGLYNCMPTFLMYRVDDILLYSTHLRGEVTMNGPQFEVRGRSTTLFAMLDSQFRQYLNVSQIITE